MPVKQLLMCYPEYFGVTYDINPWMSNNIGYVDVELAKAQWNKLYNAVSTMAKVKVLDGIPELPDLVFTANAGVVKKNIAVVSKFSKKERRPEETHFSKWFMDNDFFVLNTKSSYEGEGDHLVDRWGRNWVGTGFRTHISSMFELATIFMTPMRALTLVDPRWYHLDTCFCPLPKGELLWYPGAFSEVSKKQIMSAFDHRIAISEQDALAFACNSVCIGHDIFIPKNVDVSPQLEVLGYKVHEFELSEFMKAGGAAKCLVLKLANIE